ncbi:hypothetical protein BCR39DRAFT_559323 [Naematelia encephala]|uniref:Sterol 3-beta-glucosyltransferase n=1 Tax=Naematelia encephala TaxID=71784 RepID=A0A1Y2B2R7_9TREE|nr:hypothetical protein BCR39DRAFT_559323 [Naematelia encephala]
MSSSDDQLPNPPLFPLNATDPDTRSPPPHHPHAEALLDAAAQHVFPRRAPKEDEEKPKQDIQQTEGDDADDEDDQQEPIMRGTPLDDLRTPMFEEPNDDAHRGKTDFRRKIDAVRHDTTETLRPVEEMEKPIIKLRQDTQSGGHVLEPDSPSSHAGRPGFGAMRDMGSVRMGASALISALNALPWDGDEEGDSSDSEEEERQVAAGRRPKMAHVGSSLHTIRPMVSNSTVKPHPSQSLHFPFRENTIARRARSPAPTELNFQFRGSHPGEVPLPRGFDADSLRGEDGLHISNDAVKLVQDRVEAEEKRGAQEEKEEILRAEVQGGPASKSLILEAPIGAESPSENNTDAALREEIDEVVEERMEPTIQERKRLRREKLADKLQEVFGLEEREEVLEELRCWLLRMLKGYMYLTRRHLCFFAHMPHRENLVVKTGPLYKKASRTKLNTKFWVVLKNDVLSWYESTADPYFPKGNVSLQYASSCDAIDETKFKLRTPERNYTFTADTESSRDEWIKAIEKVMFKTQHEGESVKLIIPLEVIVEIDWCPTLEFTEAIEVKCVDPEDQMSVDSYFFASFQDNKHAFEAIQARLDERPSSELPRVSSATSLQSQDEAPARRPRTASDASSHLGIRKLGSVLRPFMSRSSEKSEETEPEKERVFSIPFLRGQKPSHDSLETLRTEQPSPMDQSSPIESDGYPPRQSGPPPAGMGEDGSIKWAPGWMKKPASKIFGTSPGTSYGRSPPSDRGLGRSADSADIVPRTRSKRASVTEVVEPVIADSESSEDERDMPRRATRHAKTPRLSFASGSSGSQMRNSKSDYSMMEESEGGASEDRETERKFRSVFALGDKEVLIDHFPGYLYRVLPVSGRFFVSTNYLCFRSSQLLYKTKMIIPIRDLYGLKAQKAFRFGHSGLIVVIKGHEELFLEFSSSKRRKACVALLEERMEAVRVQSASGEEGESNAHRIKTHIMDDLDESAPMEPRTPGAGADPSPLFASTTSTMLEFKPEPMRITCLTIGSRGDVQPYIALCKGLQAEGHHTKIATHGEYKDWVEGHGIEFASVGGDPAELMQMCVDNGMFTVSFLKEGLQKFRGWLDDLLNSSWEACQNSDLLIESPSAMGGIHVAEALRIPYFRAFTMPWTRTRAYPHAFAVPEHKRGGSYNYMTYTMFDQVFWRAISGQINRWRKHVLGIDSTNFDKLEQHKVPFLYNFSPNVVPPPLDWTEWIHVTGYWFLENADDSAAKDKEKKWTPPEGLVDFIDGAHAKGKKVVYIGFGSIVVSDPEEMTRCVVDAVIDSGVCAILSKGWSDRGSKGKADKEEKDGEGADGIKYPAEIFSIDSIDHSWLFPRIDAACHHGGAGTSGASLRAGIPTIIKPFFGDQAFWAERVESLNVGSAVRKLTAESLAEALRKATTDEKQIAKAKVVGEMIRKENGVKKAIEAIYRDLEYAKSLIKSPPENKAISKSNSILPLSHHDLASLVHSRSRSRSSPQKPSSRPLSVDPSDKEHGSDESWSVLSDAGEGRDVV